MLGKSRGFNKLKNSFRRGFSQQGILKGDHGFPEGNNQGLCPCMLLCLMLDTSTE